MSLEKWRVEVKKDKSIWYSRECGIRKSIALDPNYKENMARLGKEDKLNCSEEMAKEREAIIKAAQHGKS